MLTLAASGSRFRNSWLRSDAARAACSNSGFNSGRSGKPVAKRVELLWLIGVYDGLGF